jgi:hypothetical protein
MRSLNDKKLVLLNHMQALENTYTDNQMIETLKVVNSVLDSFTVDQYQMREALDTLNEAQFKTQEINKEYS